MNGRPGLARWHGELALDDCWASWTGQVGDSHVHGHQAVQAVLGAAVDERVGEHWQTLDAGAIFLEPGTPHRVHPARHAQLLFLEPAASLSSPTPATVPAPLRERVAAALAHGQLVGLPSAARPFWPGWDVNRAADADPGEAAWTATVRRLIDARLPEGVLRLATVAEALGLSAERFRHVFAERQGLPLRRYVMWRRLRLGVLRLQAGAGVTEAAMDAGFADAAHFGRTLQRQFGLNARKLFH